MVSKQSLFLIFLPTCVWAYAGGKLLFKTNQYIDWTTYSLIKLVITIIIAWALTSVKYHCIFKKSVDHQIELAKQMLTNKISKLTYTKNTIVSKKVLFIFLAISPLLRKYADTYILTLIRLAVGYSLVRTAISYSVLSKKLLSK